ncbi:MAG: hypothetical protein ABR509_00180 [Candidatus Limnocylindria bacterium]
MTPHHRADVGALLTAGLLTAVLLVVFAARSCPGPSGDDVCAGAGVNRMAVVALACAAIGLVITPFAFLAEYAARRRIVYRGSWARAARRGALAAAIVAVLAGLRLGGALSPPLALAIVLVPIAAEVYMTRIDVRRGATT